MNDTDDSIRRQQLRRLAERDQKAAELRDDLQLESMEDQLKLARWAAAPHTFRLMLLAFLLGFLLGLAF